MTDNNLSHRAQLAKEIEDALRTSARPLSSAELNGMCPSSQDSTDIGRVIYYLKDQGIVTQADLVKSPGRSPTRTWKLIGAAAVDSDQAPVTDAEAADSAAEIAKLTDYLAADVASGPTLREILAERDTETAPPAAAGHSAEIPVTPEEDEFCAHCMARAASSSRSDQTELSLADLVDQTDEAVLALADSLLSDNPAWQRMRRLQEDVFGALCDYRSLTSMEGRP